MPNIPFAGVQTIASSTAAQPAFGTTATASAIPMYDMFAGNVTGANPSQCVLAVASTAGFNPGQYIVIGTAAQLGTASPNMGRVVSIASSTSMTVAGLTQSVASGAYVILCENAESVTITPSSSNSGQLYIGKDSTTSSTSAAVFAAPTPGQAFHAETADSGHPYTTSLYWLAGTLNDTCICSFTQG